MHRPRGLDPVEPRLLEGDARCPPTSSWWALETPVTMARSGSGRRPSGGHGGGGGAIRGEIALQPPPPVFFKHPWSDKRIQNRIGVGGKRLDCSRAVRWSCLFGNWSAATDRAGQDSRHAAALVPKAPTRANGENLAMEWWSRRCSAGATATLAQCEQVVPAPRSERRSRSSRHCRCPSTPTPVPRVRISDRRTLQVQARSEGMLPSKGETGVAWPRTRLQHSIVATALSRTEGGQGTGDRSALCWRDPHRPPDPGPTAMKARPWAPER